MRDAITNIGWFWGSEFEFDRLKERLEKGHPIYVLKIHHSDDAFKFTMILPTKSEAMVEMRSLRKNGVTCPISITKKQK